MSTEQFQEIRNLFSQVLDRLDMLESRFVKLEGRVGSVETMVGNMVDDIVAIRGKVNGDMKE